ncbi:hypothetical protein BJ138DRAFT_1016430 [Hygrophoropsis aurantiaca]|uniref:Uncharacterized protein n=1 Tax=Hygrophoropsis aurantiaca TaxID=72124 RepID=A0ACB7ZYJ3_9AGAM|nr:hypothetical protein BJ138DRAFT_1016430 [Hygrophoropsis aurantiaca]
MLGIPLLDGHSDENPTWLPQVTANAFELFVSVSYGQYVIRSTFHNDAVIGLLRLSDMYMSQRARDWAIHHIFKRRFYLKPSQLIATALRYNVKKFFVNGFCRLARQRFNDITTEDRSSMGFIVFSALVDLKESLTEHRSIVACEEPVITVHANDCFDQDKCGTEWRQLWWNGMGRFLMDGRNPQPYQDAVERFEKIEAEIGHVGVGCWHKILKVVKDGSAFELEQRLIDDTAEQLAAALISEPGPMDISAQASN